MTLHVATVPSLDELAGEVLARCEALAVEGERPGGLTRTFPGAPMRRVHEHLSAWMRGDGMTVRLDPAANLIGRLPASVGGEEAPVLLIGSHLDTVPDAGKYDGSLGVLLGVEQGPVLETWDAPVGVVTGIAGQSRLWLAFEGRAAHAVTAPMDLRHDALPAAAELVLEVERLARSVDGLRGTVGAIAASPGASNVVPGSATLSLDVRHAEDDVRERAVADLIAFGGQIATRRGLAFRVDQAQHNRTIPADPRLADLLASAVEGVGLAPRRLVSGAGHDAAVMASLAPMAMLFVRSPGGISHHPDERVLPGDVRIALEVMMRLIDAIAEGAWTPGGP